MGNNRRQVFRLVWTNALRPVCSGVLHVPHVRMLGAYNGALASGVCELTSILFREGPTPPYMSGGLGYNM